jgi:hypothetical protein
MMRHVETQQVVHYKVCEKDTTWCPEFTQLLHWCPFKTLLVVKANLLESLRKIGVPLFHIAKKNSINGRRVFQVIFDQ